MNIEPQNLQGGNPAAAATQAPSPAPEADPSGWFATQGLDYPACITLPETPTAQATRTKADIAHIDVPTAMLACFAPFRAYMPPLVQESFGSGLRSAMFGSVRFRPSPPPVDQFTEVLRIGWTVNSLSSVGAALMQRPHRDRFLATLLRTVGTDASQAMLSICEAAKAVWRAAAGVPPERQRIWDHRARWAAYTLEITEVGRVRGARGLRLRKDADEVIADLRAWASGVPDGDLAIAAAEAGMTAEEATAAYQQGTLTMDALRVWAALKA